jgi:Mg2+-importing ATPase
LKKPDKTLDHFWDVPQRDLLALLEATPAGLTSAEARRRLRLHGPNSLAAESRFAALIGFLGFFANPLVLILLAASAISIVLGDPVGGSIIISIVLLSVVVNFYVGFQARHAVEDIRKEVATTAAVLREGDILDDRSRIIYTIIISSILYFQRNTTGAALISSKY